MSTEIKKYRPSNGTEGCFFAEQFCDRCAHEKFTHTGDITDPACEILVNSMLYYVDNENYPDELRYGDDGNPTCTKFKKHIWRDEFTGDLIEPEPEEEHDPDQLDLFENQ